MGTDDWTCADPAVSEPVRSSSPQILAELLLSVPLCDLDDDKVLEVYGMLDALEKKVAARMKEFRPRVIALASANGEQVSLATKRLDHPAGKFTLTIGTTQKVDEDRVALRLAAKGLAIERCFDRVERLVFNSKAFERLVASGVFSAEDVKDVVTTTTTPRLAVSSVAPVVF